MFSLITAHRVSVWSVQVGRLKIWQDGEVLQRLLHNVDGCLPNKSRRTGLSGLLHVDVIRKGSLTLGGSEPPLRVSHRNKTGIKRAILLMEILFPPMSSSTSSFLGHIRF